MMNIRFVKILSLLLAFVCIVQAVASCGEAENTEAQSGATETVNAVTVNDSYSFIIPAMLSATETQLANALYDVISEKCGDLEKRKDSVKDNASSPQLEILFGDTNREESKIELDDDTDYTVRIVGKKLVIKAKSVVLMDEACLYLSEKIKTDGLDFPSDFCYNGKTALDKKLIITGNYPQCSVDIYDVTTGLASEPVWTSKIFPQHSAGIKIRKTDKYGTVILHCSGRLAKVTSYDTKEALVSATAADNAHSVEITPNGNIFAVASSDGGEVRFYNTDNIVGGYSYVKLEDAHGVLYDDKRDCFYMVGRNKMLVYKASVEGNNKVELTRCENGEYTIPSDYAHDLAAVSGDGSELWISTTNKVYIFNKDNGSFNVWLEQADVKGIGSFTDGTVCYIYPDGKYEDWTSCSYFVTYKLKFIDKEHTQKLSFGNQNHFYKIRPFITDYTY